MKIIFKILLLLFCINTIYAQKAKHYYYYEDKFVSITLSSDKIHSKYSDSIIYKVVLKNISEDEILCFEKGFISLSDDYSLKIGITKEGNSTFLAEMKKLEPDEEKLYFFTVKPLALKNIRKYGLISARLEMQYIADFKKIEKRINKDRIKWKDNETVILDTDIINSSSQYFNFGVLDVMLSETGK